MNELYNALIEFHFLRPLWLLALIPLALLIVALLRSEGRSGEWSNIVDANLLPHLLVGRESKQSNLPIILLGVVWLLTVIALAGPTWKQLPQPVEQKTDPLVIMLDLSLSMKATDLTPSRLDQAKYKLLDILRMREEGVTALLVYAGSAHVVTPMTDDTKTVQSLVPGLDPEIMPVSGSDFPTGLQRAVELLQAPDYPNGHILLITDGIREADLDSAEDILDGTRYTLSVLGVGTLEGSPIPLENGAFVRDANGAIVIPKLQRKTLQALASQHGGQYADLGPSDSDIKRVLQDGSVLSQNTHQVKRQFDVWSEEGAWLLLLIVPLASLAYRRGWLNVVVLMLLLPASQNSEASWWEDIWQTQDQQAYQKFRSEDYAGAADQFENSIWKGGAHYKNGDYEAALEDWQITPEDQNQNANPAYNQGNALAHLGKLEEAIEAYDKALEIDPNHEDAIHNKQIVEEMLKQQQDQQNQQGDSQQDQQQDQSNDQQQNDQQQQSDNQQQSDQQNQQSEQQEQNSDQQSQQDEQQSSNEDQQQAQKDQQQDQQEAQQQPEKQDSEDSEQQAQQQAKKEQSSLEELQKQARQELTFEEEMTSDEQKEVERWLQRVPDDPGGLMRRKFLYESQKSQLQRSDMNAW